jgi:hypothetical protein
MAAQFNQHLVPELSNAPDKCNIESAGRNAGAFQ